MTIENQLVNLELSIKLAELGVKGESYFVWRWFWNHHEEQDIHISTNHLVYSVGDEGYYKVIPAYSVAELGTLLPEIITYGKDYNGFYAIIIVGEWKEGNSGKYVEHAETEADVRAKMLIYLKENNLI